MDEIEKIKRELEQYIINDIEVDIEVDWGAIRYAKALKKMVQAVRIRELEGKIELMNEFMDDWNEKKFKQLISEYQAELDKLRGKGWLKQAGF